MDEPMTIGIDIGSADKSAICIRTPLRTPAVAAMVARLEAEGIEVIVAETDDIEAPASGLLDDLRAMMIEPPRYERFIDPHRNRPFGNSHPTSYRKRK